MSTLFLALCGLLFLTTVSYTFIDSRKREVVLGRLGIKRRRATGSLTPPRSLSPEKQGLPPNETATLGYGEVFPPHRRQALAQCQLGGSGPSAQELGAKEPDYSKRVPDQDVANADSLRDSVTATGFTVDEINRLGDFPDYAALSGVPLPSPYDAFDISEAKPRPYRPFRWAYHQTMCTFADGQGVGSY